MARFRQYLLRSVARVARLAFLAILGARSVPAQDPAASISGTVRNESALPLEQAQVILNPGRGPRELRTDRDGQFRFIGVPPGRHQLRVLRIGFQPFDSTVTVSGTTEIEITLSRLTSLREVAVVGRRLGVYGTVHARDSLKPLEGARVELLGGRLRDTTDASGGFGMEGARPGTYMLRVTRDGYDTRLVSVRVPRDTGVGLDVVLRPGSPLLDNHMEMLWADMAQRLTWAGVNASFTSRDELLDRGQSLDLAIKFAPSFARKGLVIDELACLFVDGMPRPGSTIKDYSVDEVESIEVYGRRGEMTGNLVQRWPPKVPCGNPTTRPAAGNRAFAVVIWTRR